MLTAAEMPAAFEKIKTVAGGLASPRLRPLHFGRHRRQDRIHIAAGFQSENGAAVVEQIEFDVSSAPDQLFLAVFSAPGRVVIAPHKFGIDFQECAADILREGKIGVPVAAVVPVIEKARSEEHTSELQSQSNLV